MVPEPAGIFRVGEVVELTLGSGQAWIATQRVIRGDPANSADSGTIIAWLTRPHANGSPSPVSIRIDTQAAPDAEARRVDLDKVVFSSSLGTDAANGMTRFSLRGHVRAFRRLSLDDLPANIAVSLRDALARAIVENNLSRFDFPSS